MYICIYFMYKPVRNSTSGDLRDVIGANCHSHRTRITRDRPSAPGAERTHSQQSGCRVHPYELEAITSI